MAQYLLIESNDPFENTKVERDYQLAINLAREGNEVTLFLVQNGVLPVRKGSACDHLATVVESGVTVQCDAFSLRERGIDAAQRIANVSEAALDLVVDQLAEGRKAIWL